LSNDQIIELLKLSASLMELHDENAFKIRSIQNAAFNLEKISISLASAKLEELEKIEGIGKGIAGKIHEINTTQTFKDLQDLLNKTPSGVIELLNIKGIGPKKVKTIWKQLNITDKSQLLKACEENQIAQLKGFGEKTQEAIKQSLLYVEAQKDKFLFAEIEATATKIEETLIRALPKNKVCLTGEVRRKMEIVETLQLLICSNSPTDTFPIIEKLNLFEFNELISGPFVKRGIHKETGIKVELKIYSENEYYSKLLIHSASETHLATETESGKSLLQFTLNNRFGSEDEIYSKAFNISVIPPEAREGFNEVSLAKEGKLNLIQYSDLKGIFHNHTTYSDGKHSLEEMAEACKKSGFEYLGISDHSKTAFYADGLNEMQVEKQQQEIDQLNKKMAPFKIFKGIESDILNDGSLDYDHSVLKSFDFIVASIHSNLKMSKEKATQRLITAIENPYTTMLGHSTGRLLLKREGYPIDHKKVIDACAANKVIIEINANPWRLDMDWRWIPYALEKNVLISINPDAHEIEGYLDMYYGVHVGRKACLSKEMTFNSFSLDKVEAYLKNKKG
jgi:DNA polymerase (family X)